MTVEPPNTTKLSAEPRSTAVAALTALILARPNANTVVKTTTEILLYVLFIIPLYNLSVLNKDRYTLKKVYTILIILPKSQD